VDAPAFAGAVSQLRDAAGGPLTATGIRAATGMTMPLSHNARTALVLVSIAAVFFLGIMLKYWILG
jgi:hypothetical protein